MLYSTFLVPASEQVTIPNQGIHLGVHTNADRAKTFTKIRVFIEVLGSIPNSSELYFSSHRGVTVYRLDHPISRVHNKCKLIFEAYCLDTHVMYGVLAWMSAIKQEQWFT